MHKFPNMSPDVVLLVFMVLIVSLAVLTPFIWVLASRRSHGGAKFGWFLVVIMFSWLGLAVFLIVTQTPLSNSPRKKSSSSIKTGFQISAVLIIITTLSILWLEFPPGISSVFLDKLALWILLVLTWPFKPTQLWYWSFPLINFVQGFALAFFLQFLKQIMARKNVVTKPASENFAK